MSGEPLKAPDELYDRAGEVVIRHNAPARLDGIEWPAFSYINTRPLDYGAGKIRVKFVATDQGWGNTGFCYVLLRVTRAGSGAREDLRLGTLTHDVSRCDLLVEDERVTQAARRGAILSIVVASAPWGGYSAHIRSAEIAIWYAFKERYEMAIIRAQLDRYDAHRVYAIFDSAAVDSESSGDIASSLSSTVGHFLRSALGLGAGLDGSLASTAPGPFSDEARRAMVFLFVKCDALLFSIIVKFAYD